MLANLGRSGPRVRTGCMTCRQRKVKCDEHGRDSGQSCANCNRLRVHCSYVDNRHPPHAPSPSTADVTPPLPSLPPLGPPPPPSTSHSIPNSQSILSEPFTDTYTTIPTSNLLFASIPAEDLASVNLWDVFSFDPASPALSVRGPPSTSSSDFAPVPAFPHTPPAFSPEFASLSLNPLNTVNTSNNNTTTPPTNVTPTSQPNNALLDSILFSAAKVLARPITYYEQRVLVHFINDTTAPVVISAGADWKNIRMNLLHMAAESSALLLAILAFSDIHLARQESRAPAHAAEYYVLASRAVESFAAAAPTLQPQTLKHSLYATFLLAYVDILCPQPTRPELAPHPHLRWAHSLWAQLKLSASVKTVLWQAQLITWLTLLDAKAVFNGSDGLFLNESPTDYTDPVSSPQLDSAYIPYNPVSTTNVHEVIYSMLNYPALSFNLRAQLFIGRIIKLDRWHRPRGSNHDETTVLQAGRQISIDLHNMWHNRPRILDLLSPLDSDTQAESTYTFPNPKRRRDNTSSSNSSPASTTNSILLKPRIGLDAFLHPTLARQLERAFRTYITSFFSFFIFLHRTAYVNHARSQDVLRAIQIIKYQINELWSITVDNSPTSPNAQDPLVSSVNCNAEAAVLMPLFFCAIECDPQDREWFYDKIRSIGRLQHVVNASKTLSLAQEIVLREQNTGTRADARSVMIELYGSDFIII